MPATLRLTLARDGFILEMQAVGNDACRGGRIQGGFHGGVTLG